MKTIEFNPLSRKSVLHAKREVLRYKKDLEQKFEKFVNELKNTGFDILNAKISAIPPVYRGDIVPHVELGGSQGKYTIKLIISGSDVAFVEFGTGITFNGSAGSSPHPKGAEMGMLIGEYGKKKGAKPTGWFFTNQYGDVEHTYGIPMQAPLFFTSKELKEKIESIAQKSFRG